MCNCSICNRADRGVLEQDFIVLATESNMSVDEALAYVSDKYECSSDELKVHALFHMPNGQESLARRVKLREADILTDVIDEYKDTLQAMGLHIKGLMSKAEDKEVAVAKMLTKPMTEMYLGLGGEIRQSVKTLAELDRLLNGPEDSTGTGLVALAEAIKGSSQ